MRANTFMKDGKKVDKFNSGEKAAKMMEAKEA